MKALVATALLFVTAVCAAAGWFAMQPAPLGGEPFAVVDVDSTKRPGGYQAPVRPESAATPVEQPAAQQHFAAAQEAVAVAPAPADTVPSAPVLPPAAASLPPVPVAPVPDGPIVLASAPDDALVESTRYGLLPKVSSDGRRPSDVYARPSREITRPRPGEPARIAILINGLGLSELATTRAIERLPGPVTLAFGAYGQNLQGWIRSARGAGHEVMLQIPLEPFDYPDNDPGPHTLLTNLPPDENLKRLRWLMGRFTGYTGVTNHMGAKFVAAHESFLPVLEELQKRGLMYLDDGTAGRSTAGPIARDLGLGFASSQLAIDAEPSPERIDAALDRLAAIAREQGLAIGIGSALPATIDRIAEWAKAMQDKGIVLVPVSAVVRAQHQS